MKGSWFGNANKAFGNQYTADIIASWFDHHMTSYYTVANSINVLDCAEELLQKQLIPESQAAIFLTRSNVYLAQHTVRVLEVGTSCISALTGEQLLIFAEAVDLNDNSQVVALEQLFNACQGHEKALCSPAKYTQGLLVGTAKTHGSDHDFLLQLWAKDLEITSDVLELICGDQLNDAQSNRLLGQLKNRLTFEQFCEILPKLVGDINATLTRQQAVEFDVMHWANEPEQRKLLAMVLVRSFGVAIDSEQQNSLIEKLKLLNLNKAKTTEKFVLEYLKSEPTLDQQQQDLLVRHFSALKNDLEKYARLP